MLRNMILTALLYSPAAAQISGQNQQQQQNQSQTPTSPWQQNGYQQEPDSLRNSDRYQNNLNLQLRRLQFDHYTTNAVPTYLQGINTSSINITGITGSVQCLQASAGGAVSGTGSACAVPTNYISVSTIPTTAAVTSISGNACINGSTMSFTLSSSSQLEIDLSMQLKSAGSGSATSANIIIDSQFVDNFTASSPMIAVNNSGSSSPTMGATAALAHYLTINSYAGGAHSACVTGKIGASGSFDCGSGSCYYHISNAVF